MESNSKPWRLPVGTDLQTATRQDDKTANRRWKTVSFRRPSPSRVSTTVACQRRVQPLLFRLFENTSKKTQKGERRGYSCGKRLRLSKTTTTTTSSSPNPRGRPNKSHGKVGRPWSRRNPINPTRREKCRSEVQSGSWRLQQAPRFKRRLTLGTLPCQIVSNHAAKLPRVPSASSCREAWNARIQSPSSSLGVMAVLSWPWTVSPLSAPSHDISTKARPGARSIKAAERGQKLHGMQARARGLTDS